MNIRDIWKRVISDIKAYYKVVLLFIALYIIVTMIFGAFCPFVIITGFPCAGCGMTRAVWNILTGNFVLGVNYNPAVLFWIAWGIYFVISRYILGKNSKWVMRTLEIVCVVTLAIYVFRMLTQFPGEPPMTYYKENVLSKLLRYIS